MMTSLIWFCILAYLVGSIPTGKIISRYKGIDIESVGSGNIGASNTFFILGKKMAFLVLLGDLGKAYAVIYSAILFEYGMADVLLIGVFLILGNTKSIFLSFRGGKGIATSLGIFLATEPYVAVVLFLLWLVALLKSKLMGLAGIAGLLSVPITYYSLGHDLFTMFCAFLICIIILLKHKSNFALKEKKQAYVNKSFFE